MKKLLALGSLLLALTVTSQAYVLTFDDLPGVENSLIPGGGYGGIDNWNNVYTLSQYTYPGSGYDTGNVSPDNVAYNGFGSPASFSNSVDFNLDSGYFTSAWSDQWVTISGLNNGSTLYSNSYWVTTAGPTLLDLGYLGVDEVQISTSSSHVAWDNLTINGSSSVPDGGSTVLMFGAAIAGFAALRRRRA